MARPSTLESTANGAPLTRQVGIGHRPEIAADLVLAPSSVGFIEVVAETCYAQRATRKEISALAELWPVVPHGVKLSLGTVGGIDRARVDRLAALTRDLEAPFVSEHVAMTRAPAANFTKQSATTTRLRQSISGGREIGHLTQLPRTRQAVRVVARNVADARLRLPDVPLLLENVAWSTLWPEDEMDEATFYQEIVQATGCPLLLDVGNLYANAVNEGLSPSDVLAAYPIEQVGMIHVAGGIFEDGFYFDTHAHDIPEAVLDLVANVFARLPDVPVVLERDANFGPFADLKGELDRVRALRPSARTSARRSGGRAPPAPAPEVDDLPTYAMRQTQLAHLLTDVTLRACAIAEAFGIAALRRARGILERKRVDDALPLLANLGRSLSERSQLRALADQTMGSTVRAARGAGPGDALAIATAVVAATAFEGRGADGTFAAADDRRRLHDAAVRDRLILRARFYGPDGEGCTHPRVAPFIGSEQLADGTKLRAVKGVGPFAPVHLSERKKRPWNEAYRSPRM